jgi:hypothetical protein
MESKVDRVYHRLLSEWIVNLIGLRLLCSPLIVNKNIEVVGRSGGSRLFGKQEPA